MEYSIGSVAKELGVTIDTIRYYDKEGLLPFVKRNKSGHRIFTKNDLHLMRTIVCLKNAGVPVKQIASFIELRLKGDTTLNERYEMLVDHEKNLLTKINDLQDTLSYLKFKKWYYETAVKSGTKKIHFINDNNEVDPNLAIQYDTYLKKTKQFQELERFQKVKDYRNRE